MPVVGLPNDNPVAKEVSVVATMSIAAGETRIRELIDEQIEAIRTYDADTLTARYTPDVAVFSLAPPLQTTGPDQEGLKAWFASWKGPIGYEIHDLHVETSEDLAFCHGLTRLRATGTDGNKVDLWSRLTLCLRQVGGQWKVAHEHQSVPFYMDGSLKAAVDLKP
jgi:PhnB protein